MSGFCFRVYATSGKQGKYTGMYLQEQALIIKKLLNVSPKRKGLIG